MSALNVAEEMTVAVPEHADAATIHATRPFLWSIRRELWENPSIIIAPAAMAVGIVCAIFIAAVRFTGDILTHLEIDKAAPSSIAAAPLLAIPIFLGITMVLVAAFYSLDALLSERRDRSILFWKSLPVSDTTTVLSKLAVPMVLLPIVTFIVATGAQIVVFIIENIAFLTHHVALNSAWDRLHWLWLLGTMAYTLAVITLWYAPIYAWLLLVSAWARRTALVWAVIPFFLLAGFERIAFHTRHVNRFFAIRFAGIFQVAFSKNYTAYYRNGNFRMENYDFNLTPGHFLATPGLWGGLIFTALAVLLIIRLRRSSDPI